MSDQPTIIDAMLVNVAPQNEAPRYAIAVMFTATTGALISPAVNSGLSFSPTERLIAPADFIGLTAAEAVGLIRVTAAFRRPSLEAPSEKGTQT